MKVAALAKDLISKGDSVIDFSVGEPDFPTPENIKSAANKAIENNFTRYTLNTGIPVLREAISKKLKNENNLLYSPNEIIVSNGAKHSIYNAINALVDEGDEVIIPAPYYVSYPEMVALAGGNSVIIETNGNNGFRITPDQLKKTITTKTKLFILCNPSNPTGAAYSESELRELIPILEEGDFLILSDEIYEKIIYDDFKFVSIAELSSKIKAKTIIINGHSKTYSMTGWRIGYAAGPENIINAMSKIQSHATSNASSVSQAAAVEALTGPQNSIEIMRSEFERRRDLLCDFLNSLEGIKCYKPRGAFYLFPNVSKYFGKTYNGIEIKNSVDLSMYLLNNAKVAIVPGSAFGAEGYVRLSFSIEMNKLIEGAERIKSALAQLK